MTTYSNYTEQDLIDLQDEVDEMQYGAGEDTFWIEWREPWTNGRVVVNGQLVHQESITLDQWKKLEVDVGGWVWDEDHKFKTSMSNIMNKMALVKQILGDPDHFKED